MSWSYSCPHCRGMLNPHETIILIGEHAGRRVLVGFHPEPGNYLVHLPPGVEAEQGSRWSFFCPVCHHDLASDLAADLCAIDLRTADDSHRVFFSCIAGDHATFVVSAEGLKESHGAHADKYQASLPHLKYIL
jgi:hypothetical protein